MVQALTGSSATAGHKAKLCGIWGEPPGAADEQGAVWLLPCFSLAGSFEFVSSPSWVLASSSGKWGRKETGDSSADSSSVMDAVSRLFTYAVKSLPISQKAASSRKPSQSPQVGSDDPLYTSILWILMGSLLSSGLNDPSLCLHSELCRDQEKIVFFLFFFW